MPDNNDTPHVVQEGLFSEDSASTPSTRSSRPRRTLSRAKAIELGLVAPSMMGKNYVLDTNVLLHDPGCLQKFEENHICISTDVLSELDRFKNEQSERGANARRVHRRVCEIFDGVSDITRGVQTDGGGSIRIVLFDPASSDKSSEQVRQFFRVFPDRDKADHRIMSCTLMIAEFNKTKTVLVTKDLNMQLKARAAGILVQDYLNDKVTPSEVVLRDKSRVEVTPHELQNFASNGFIELEEARSQGVKVNQYVLLEAGPKSTIPARFDADGSFHKLMVPDALRIPEGNHLKPLNLGQKCLIDALLNPEISLVTCFGQAGTGKTLVAIAAGLHEMFKNHYQGLVISRPVVTMGKDMGFLPGALDEKMRPWLQPIYDALDLLMTPPNQGPKRKQQKQQQGEANLKPYDKFIQQGIIEIEALAYIRGRSIPNRFFVLDEAQQLTPQEAKTVVSRISEGSKLIMLGDPAQIDNPYVDKRSNGLVYTRNKLEGQPFVAHVNLTKGERSPLAEAAAQLM